MRADEILEQAAETYRDRNKEYGENFRVFGRVMEALFPEGLTIKGEAEWSRFHLWLLAVVKLTRYVQNFKEGHDDSILDEIVYLAMTLQMDRERRNPKGKPELELCVICHRSTEGSFICGRYLCPYKPITDDDIEPPTVGNEVV